MTTEIEAGIAKLVEAVQAANNKHFADNYPRLTPPTITTDPGRRYVRIVKNDSPGSSRSVWGFVDTTNGDILKAEGWKKPAKHARGSVLNADVMQGCDSYGPHYLIRGA